MREADRRKNHREDLEEEAERKAAALKQKRDIEHNENVKRLKRQREDEEALGVSSSSTSQKKGKKDKPPTSAVVGVEFPLSERMRGLVDARRASGSDDIHQIVESINDFGAEYDKTTCFHRLVLKVVNRGHYDETYDPYFFCNIATALLDHDLDLSLAPNIYNTLVAKFASIRDAELALQQQPPPASQEHQLEPQSSQERQQQIHQQQQGQQLEQQRIHQILEDLRQRQQAIQQELQQDLQQIDHPQLGPSPIAHGVNIDQLAAELAASNVQSPNGGTGTA